MVVFGSVAVISHTLRATNELIYATPKLPTGITHRCGGTLDLVMTFSDYRPVELGVNPADIYNICRLSAEVDPPPSAVRQVRAWQNVDHDELTRAVQNSALCPGCS